MGALNTRIKLKILTIVNLYQNILYLCANRVTPVISRHLQPIRGSVRHTSKPE